MLVRRLLREDVRSELLNRLLQGVIAPGTRINEVAVARELGVSRTPLREALMHLEKEGFLRSDAARGFFVMPLTAQEVEDSYPILWTLELLALQLVGQPGPGKIQLLERTNQSMARSRQVDRILELDTRWHRELLAGCPNERLLQMISNLKVLLHRYELAYLRDAGLVAASVDHHQEVTNAYRAGDPQLAMVRMEQHWRYGMEALLRWLLSSA